jgi:hypothetical protein
LADLPTYSLTLLTSQEERTDAAITHLLKTALAKDRDAAKDARASATATLSRPADASKLKKHITLVRPPLT